jgi:transposase-like protein
MDVIMAKKDEPEPLIEEEEVEEQEGYGEGQGPIAYTYEERRLVVRHKRMYVGNIVNIESPFLPYLYVDRQTFDEPLTNVISLRNQAEGSPLFRALNQIQSQCIHLANELIVLAGIAVEYHKRKGVRHVSSFYGTLPKRKAHRLNEFMGMTKFSEKKGLIQLFYLYYLKETIQMIQAKIQVTPSEMVQKRAAAKQELERLSYLGKENPSLSNEVEWLTGEMNRIAAVNAALRKEIETMTQTIYAEEKNTIKGILNIISAYRKVPERVGIPLIRTDMSKLREKLHVQLMENISQYKRELQTYLATIQNWQEVQNTPFLKQQIQQRIDALKGRYVEQHKALINQITLEMNTIIATEFTQPLEKARHEVREATEALKPLETELENWHTHYLTKVRHYLAKYEKA